jgi:hypothetical protein
VEPVEFRCPHSLGDAVSRLEAVVEQRWFWLLPKHKVVGEVSVDRVRLRYWRAWARSGALEFVGRFTQRPDGVFLTGTFSWTWEMMTQVAALVAMGVFMVILGIVSLIGRDTTTPFPSAPFVGLGGVILMSLFLMMYRDVRGSSDTAALSAAIRNALA